MKIHIGTSGYAYREWKGKFYPQKISPKEMLGFYSQRLDSVEINNTFYRMPTEGVLSSWAEQVPEGFLFAIKTPQVITHLKRLKNVGEEVDHLFGTLAVLGRKLGAVLLQFPESFKADRTVLSDFLDLIPYKMPCAFAFRSTSWMDDKILALLRRKECSLCMEDSDESTPDVIVSTAKWGYLRLRRPDYTDADLSLWLEGIRSQEWEKVFVFFKHEEEARGAEAAIRFQKLARSG